MAHQNELLLALSLLTCAGCATSVSTLQTARVLKPGQIQVTGALEGSVHTSAVSEALDAVGSLEGELRAAESGDIAISESTQREAIEAAVALVLFTPSLQPVAVARVGLFEKAEGGLRYTGSLLRLEGKYQIAAADPSGGVDLALMGAWGHHLGVGPSFAESAFDLLDYVDLGDYRRDDAHLGLIVSRDYGDWLSLYGAARLMASFYALDATLKRVETETGAPKSSLDGAFFSAGLAGGLFVGYRYVFLNAELTVMRTWFSPEVVGREVALGGYVIAPTGGVTLRF